MLPGASSIQRKISGGCSRLNSKALDQILPTNIPNEAHAQLDKSQAITLWLSELCKRVHGRHVVLQLLMKII